MEKKRTFYLLHFLLGIGIALFMLCYERHFILQIVLAVGSPLFVGTAYECYGSIVHKAKTDWYDVLSTGAGGLLVVIIDFTLYGFFTYANGDSDRGFMWWKVVTGAVIILISYLIIKKS